ncbi:MAG: 30S ribosomal protein S3 [Opitutales bacterium]|jgi:small subunit ribosomal protein S3|nr:30S ribosomal protein S3 [Opitutales bacterium]MBT5166866.1 30S ribosomal protein S3 [Opitutales bacterium]MBT5814369.1 30S ribosomal protein S3 [Opitutales bacterium]MBT6381542.1 30S ribosomal protein S3 [Opitutales bacterium]MBT6770490.1 30S ribosomal protein S3 [Opitutales bacterium]
MGQKTHPIGFRLAVNRNWQSRWFAPKRDFAKTLHEDYIIREKLMKKLEFASVPRIFIERASARVRVKIFTARPGIVIGRKGQEIENIKEELAVMTGKDILIDIQEVKKPELDAKLVADNVALQLERRISFRRAMKKAVQIAMSLGADGIKVQVGGRLGGADIARTEVQRQGSVPLHTLRENIDYGTSTAKTVYGIIGVKCWVFNKDEK